MHTDQAFKMLLKEVSPELAGRVGRMRHLNAENAKKSAEFWNTDASWAKARAAGSKYTDHLKTVNKRVKGLGINGIGWHQRAKKSFNTPLFDEKNHLKKAAAVGAVGAGAYAAHKLHKWWKSKPAKAEKPKVPDKVATKLKQDPTQPESYPFKDSEIRSGNLQEAIKLAPWKTRPGSKAPDLYGLGDTIDNHVRGGRDAGSRYERQIHRDHKSALTSGVEPSIYLHDGDYMSAPLNSTGVPHNRRSHTAVANQHHSSFPARARANYAPPTLTLTDKAAAQGKAAYKTAKGKGTYTASVGGSMSSPAGTTTFAGYRSAAHTAKKGYMGRANKVKGSLRGVSALRGKLGAIRKSVLRASTDAAYANLMEREYIRGGKADGMSASRFPQRQLRMGRKVEKEHTNNPRIAEEIAKDHLAEIKDYYTRLAQMERRARKGMKESGMSSTDGVWANIMEGFAGKIKGKLIDIKNKLVDKHVAPSAHKSIQFTTPGSEPNNANDQKHVTKMYRILGGKNTMAPHLVRNKDNKGMAITDNPLGAGGAKIQVIHAPPKGVPVHGETRRGSNMPTKYKQSSGMSHEVGHGVLKDKGDMSHKRLEKVQRITDKHHEKNLFGGISKLHPKGYALQARLHMRAEGRNNKFVAGAKKSRLVPAKASMAGTARAQYNDMKKYSPDKAGEFVKRYKNFRRAWRKGDTMAHLKLSDTDQAFGALFEADLSKDKALVGAWRKMKATTKQEKYEGLTKRLTQKVAQHRRVDVAVPRAGRAGAGMKAQMGLRQAALKKQLNAQRPWYIRAGQKLGLVTESTEMCYAPLREVSEELLGRASDKAMKKAESFARIGARLKKRNQKPTLQNYYKTQRKKASKQSLRFEARRGEKEYKRVNQGVTHIWDAPKPPTTPHTSEVPRASGSHTPPPASTARVGWSRNKKKAALGLGVGALAAGAGYAAYRYQKNKEKARESTDACYASLMEGTPVTRQMGRAVSKKFAQLKKLEKKTGQKSDYFPALMLRQRAQRVAAQAKTAMESSPATQQLGRKVGKLIAQGRALHKKGNTAGAADKYSLGYKMKRFAQSVVR